MPGYDPILKEISDPRQAALQRRLAQNDKKKQPTDEQQKIMDLIARRKKGIGF